MKEFILDCSIALSWCFPDEANPYAMSVREALRQSKAYAPSIWPLEIANALLVAQRRGRLTASETIQLVSALGYLRVFVEEKHPRSWIEELVVL